MKLKVALAVIVLLLLQSVQGIRQPGSRRRSGARPRTNVKYGLANWVWYTIIGIGSAFILALIGALVYYFVRVRPRNAEKKKSEKYRPVGGGYVPKQQKEKEMEMYLASHPVSPLSPSYHDYGRKEYEKDI